MKLPKLLLILTFLCSIYIPSAFADDRADAMRLIDTGNTAYDSGEFRTALKDYQKAYSLTEDARLLYRIGITFENLANYQRARELLEMFLLAEPSSKYAGRVKKKISNLRKLEGTLQATIKLSSSPSGGEVFLNETDLQTAKPIGITPLSIPVGPGSHAFVVRLKGHTSQSINLSLKEGEKLEKTLTLQKEGGSELPIKEDPVNLKKEDPIVETPTDTPPPSFAQVTKVNIAPPAAISLLGYVGFGIGMLAISAASILSTGSELVGENNDDTIVPLVVTGLVLVGGSSYFLWFHDWNNLPDAASNQGGVVGIGYRTQF